MADEIAGANVVRLVKDGPKWLALIGPDPQLGLMGAGDTPADALRNLAWWTEYLTWPFDDTWQPRKQPRGTQ